MSKRKIIVLLVLACLCMNFGVYADVHQYKKEPIIVAGDEYFPPFEYVDTNGVYKGFNIDIMHAIAIEMGLDMEIKPMTWKDAKKSLELGEIDMIQGITNTTERSRQFSFSQPYLIMSQTIFIPKGNDYIKSIGDLESKRVSVQEKDVANELLNSIEGVTILQSDNQFEALQLLISGEADAYVGNRQTGLYSIQKYQYHDQVKMIGSPIRPKNYAVSVAKGNEALLTVIDEGLEIIKKNGTYDKIHDKWFGEEIGSTKDALKKYIYAFLTTLALLGGVVLMTVRVNKILRNEVDKRTREIEQSNLFKEHIINSISVGLITFDTIGIVTSVNKNVSDICQIEASISVGMPLTGTPFIDFIDQALFNDALKSGNHYVNNESTVSIGGHERIMEYNIFPIKDSLDQIQGVTITFEDITVRRQNNEQIKRRDKFESIGRLTANIAHEIRNPLTAIKTYIELIPKKMDNQAFQEQIVKDVPMVIERLNSLITELLEYAKPREAHMSISTLDRPIVEVMSLVEGELKKNGIQLETQLLPMCYVKMDSQQFKQILINLVINSIEAVKSTSDPTVKIKTVNGEQGYYVEVIDNGIGIHKEDLAIIFEPFFTKKSSGTGLGLSIAQQLAEENDGYLTVDSKVGEGTTMRLYLPKPDDMTAEVM